MVTDIAKRASRYAFLLLYILIILFITILVRTPSLVHIVKAEPLWSYRMTIGGNQRYLREIILNIGLFVPLGFFLVNADKKHRVLISIGAALFISVLIEAIQYFTFRGQCDVDDLISNTVGAAIGAVLFQILKSTSLRKAESIVLLLIGIMGCIYTVTTKPETDNADYFDFQISEATYTDGQLEIQGTCYKYSEEASVFEMVLVSGKNKIPVDVVIDGRDFVATADVEPRKYEIQVKFIGDKWISADTYVRVGETIGIEYVPGDVSILDGVPEVAVLKAYSKQYDTYVFEVDGKVLWLIGRQDLDSNTEVIYHIHTDEPEKLPEKRIQYGFDNRGFRARRDQKHANEVTEISHYRVFKVEIPTEYHVTAVVVGFNTDKVITWRSEFRVNHK